MLVVCEQPCVVTGLILLTYDDVHFYTRVGFIG